MPAPCSSGGAVHGCATIRHPIESPLVSCGRRPRDGIFTWQFDGCDDAATRIGDERKLPHVAVERRQSRACVGEANAGAKSLWKSDSIVDDGHTKCFG